MILQMGLVVLFITEMPYLSCFPSPPFLPPAPFPCFQTSSAGAKIFHFCLSLIFEGKLQLKWCNYFQEKATDIYFSLKFYSCQFSKHEYEVLQNFLQNSILNFGLFCWSDIHNTCPDLKNFEKLVCIYLEEHPSGLKVWIPEIMPFLLMFQCPAEGIFMQLKSVSLWTVLT